MSEFVPASELYDIESRTPIAHPAHQATDADVRRALEQREIRTDGGNASSDTEHSVGNQDLDSRDEAPAWQTKPAISASNGIRSRSEMQDAYEAISEYGLNGDKLDSCLQVLPANVEKENRLSRKLETATERERGDR